MQSKNIHAQSVWDGGKDKMNSVKEKGQKEANTVKSWKKHIEQWGLDNKYNYALLLGARLNTNGWSGGVYFFNNENSYLKKKGKQTLWELHFSEIKHEKEVRQTGSANNIDPSLGKNSSYILGKVNSLYTLQLGYGKQQLVFPALLDGNLSISIRYAGGAALAIMKPYYLRMINTDFTTPTPTYFADEEKYSESNATRFLQPGNILGGDKWTKGLGEMQYRPGAFAELAFVIEPDKNKAFIQSITIGGNIAFYSSKLTIMADQKAYPFQASFFVGLALGKRWK